VELSEAQSAMLYRGRAEFRPWGARGFTPGARGSRRGRIFSGPPKSLLFGVKLGGPAVGLGVKPQFSGNGNRLCPSINQDARSASKIFLRAAQTAGRNPPISPITRAKSIDSKMMAGERVNRKASSEKVLKFMVEIVITWRKEARSRPAAPPTSDRRSA